MDGDGDADGDKDADMDGDEDEDVIHVAVVRVSDPDVWRRIVEITAELDRELEDRVITEWRPWTGTRTRT
jgi:hypothetical protein